MNGKDTKHVILKSLLGEHILLEASLKFGVVFLRVWFIRQFKGVLPVLFGHAKIANGHQQKARIAADLFGLSGILIRVTPRTMGGRRWGQTHKTGNDDGCDLSVLLNDDGTRSLFWSI